MSKLELAWAVAFPQTSSLRAAPVIVGSTIFYSATDSGRVFALDTNSGCAKWVYNADTRLRSSMAYAVIDGLGTLVFSDGRGMIHTINAENGEAIWVASGQASDNQAMITGTPVIHEDKIIVHALLAEMAKPSGFKEMGERAGRAVNDPMQDNLGQDNLGQDDAAQGKP